MAYSSTTGRQRGSRVLALGEGFHYEGLLTARSDGDPRGRRSGLPCPSAWFRLFPDHESLLDVFCAERGLTDPERIAESLPTFAALYVRSLDVIDLDVVHIPAHKPVGARALDCREPDMRRSWPIVQRCMTAIGVQHPGGFIVDSDRNATSIFIALAALADHTRIDRLEPVPIATLLAERARRDPDALTL